jgi:hypothetical protein
VSPDRSCAHCGQALSERDRDVRYGLPDAVFARPEAERREAWTMPEELPDLVAFEEHRYVRALFPIHLDDRSSVTFGMWLEVSLTDFNHAVGVWFAPGYGDLALEGRISNALPPWGPALLGLSCTARVLVDDQVPWVVASADPFVSRLLTEPWTAAEVTAALPG